MVLAIVLIHDIIEIGGHLPNLGFLYFLPITLFVLPAIYAALNFGWAGTVATVAWITALNLPNWFLWHVGMQRAGVIIQFSILSAIAILVGWYVDREKRARKQAETTGSDLVVSENRYRHLFQSSPVSVLFLDASGLILQANAVAGRLFGSEDSMSVEGRHLADLVGHENAARLLAERGDARSKSEPIALTGKDGTALHMQPVLRRIGLLDGKDTVQLVLRDITEEHNQKAGLKAYVASVTRAQEEERLRMARELHDEVIQSVSLLCMKLDSAEASLDNVPPELTNELSAARSLGEKVVKDLRCFVKSLRPPLLDDLGLVASVRKLLVDLADRSTAEVHLQVLGQPQRLQRDTELGFYRIAQEALLNVERHSGAKNVTVELAFGEQRLTLKVIDDGKGFAMPSSPVYLVMSGHLGLIGMQERAELLGGRLSIESGVCQGTKVSVYVDLPSARPGIGV